MTVLHILGDKDPTLARAAMDAGLAAGDTVVVALVGEAEPALPAGVSVHRAAGPAGWNDLLDLIFTADQVIAW